MKWSSSILQVLVVTALMRFSVHAFQVPPSIQRRNVASALGWKPKNQRQQLTTEPTLIPVQKGRALFCVALKSNKTDIWEKLEENAGKLALFGGVGFLYWYRMVLGAFAASQGLPGIPSFLPLTPGWPQSMEELQPALEDSAHFFYLADLLKTTDAPTVQPVRLALFNIAEAWIFAYLPALWSDPKRLPRLVLLILWLVLRINLTNAFLAPYLFVTEVASAVSPPNSQDVAGALFPQNNSIVSIAFAVVALAVTGTASFSTATRATSADWEQIQELIQSDRTYLAFVVDLCLFSIFQPFILHRARGSSGRSLDIAPFVGLVAWYWNPLARTTNKSSKPKIKCHQK